MYQTVNLLMLENVRGNAQQKLTKDKRIYQLQNIDNDTYRLSPFDTLVFKGHFKEYLKENGIKLCYKIDDRDVEMWQTFGNLIRTYDVNEKGYIILHKRTVPTKKYERKD